MLQMHFVVPEIENNSYKSICELRFGMCLATQKTRASDINSEQRKNIRMTKCIKPCMKYNIIAASRSVVSFTYTDLLVCILCNMKNTQMKSNVFNTTKAKKMCFF